MVRETPNMAKTATQNNRHPTGLCLLKKSLLFCSPRLVRQPSTKLSKAVITTSADISAVYSGES
jgi:hypothetical protein